MKQNNLSSEEKLLLLGFSDIPQLQVPLFIVFSLIYLITLVGNLLIMATVYTCSHLHTPMYFFLTNLAFVDISYSSVIFPQMLAHFFQGGTYISLLDCLLQMYFFLFMVATEFVFLTVMAYDRYVAICNPLRYTTIMNYVVCMRLAAGSWGFCFTVPLAHTILISKLSFCAPYELNHFFCDMAALLKYSCSDTSRIEIMTYFLASTLMLISFLTIIVSYINIVSSILKITSKGGRRKAFSTCASHLTVVILYYGSLCSTYVRPASTYSSKDKIMSLSYIVITPLFNPFIYTLKNSEFKHALIKNRVQRRL